MVYLKASSCVIFQLRTDHSSIKDFQKHRETPRCMDGELSCASWLCSPVSVDNAEFDSQLTQSTGKLKINAKERHSVPLWAYWYPTMGNPQAAQGAKAWPKAWKQFQTDFCGHAIYLNVFPVHIPVQLSLSYTECSSGCSPMQESLRLEKILTFQLYTFSDIARGDVLLSGYILLGSFHIEVCSGALTSFHTASEVDPQSINTQRRCRRGGSREIWNL